MTNTQTRRKKIEEILLAGGLISSIGKKIESLIDEEVRESRFSLEELKEIKYWLFTVPHSQEKETMPIQFQNKLDKIIKYQKGGEGE